MIGYWRIRTCFILKHQIVKKKQLLLHKLIVCMNEHGKRIDINDLEIINFCIPISISDDN